MLAPQTRQKNASQSLLSMKQTTVWVEYIFVLPRGKRTHGMIGKHCLLSMGYIFICWNTAPNTCQVSLCFAGYQSREVLTFLVGIIGCNDQAENQDGIHVSLSTCSLQRQYAANLSQSLIVLSLGVFTALEPSLTLGRSGSTLNYFAPFPEDPGIVLIGVEDHVCLLMVDSEGLP